MPVTGKEGGTEQHNLRSWKLSRVHTWMRDHRQRLWGGMQYQTTSASHLLCKLLARITMSLLQFDGKQVHTHQPSAHALYVLTRKKDVNIDLWQGVHFRWRMLSPIYQTAERQCHPPHTWDFNLSPSSWQMLFLDRLCPKFLTYISSWYFTRPVNEQ